ncbi:MAG: DUF2911 domain-containing protein [Chitinophagaceae bacterium]
MMKIIITGAVFVCAVFTGFGQNKISAMDQSPMDMCYYPANFPILKIQDKITEPLVARVIYSRPQISNRTIFGELVEYDKVWRLGANEATEIEFFFDVTVGNKTVPRGRYTLYAIPSTEKWMIIINTETNTWGSFKYHSKKDVVRVEAPVQKLNDQLEPFTMYFEKSSTGFTLSAAWEKFMVTIPMKISAKTSAKKPVKTTKKILP